MQQPSPEAGREKLVNELRDELVDSGISDSSLLACKLLEARIRRAMSAHGSAAAKMPATTLLRRVLTAVVEHDREKPDAWLQLRAAAEFIGLPDPTMPNPIPKGYEETKNDASNARQMRLLRGGQFLPNRGGPPGPITAVRSIGKHVDTCLRTLLEAIDIFLADASLVRSSLVVSDNDRQDRPSQHLAVQPNAATDAAHVHSANAPRYIRRPALERQFADLLNNGTKLIIFIGHPGMGKTTLAEALARKHSPEGDMPATIRFAHRDLTVSSLRRALSRHRLVTTGLTLQNFEERLEDLLCSDNAPTFVVLDGFRKSSELRQLLPDDTRSTIVVTCDYEDGLGISPDQVVKVGSMAPLEAIEMVRRRLPDLSFQDRYSLVAAGRGYPLALDFLCRLAENQSASPLKISDSLSDRPLALVETAKTDHGDTLAAVLSLMIDALRDENEAALNMLACMTFVERTAPMYPAFLSRLVADHRATPDDFRYATAVHALRKYHLIGIETERRIGLDPMVQPILRALLQQKIIDVGVRALQVLVHYYLPDPKEEGTEMSSDTAIAMGAALEHCLEILHQFVIAARNSGELSEGSRAALELATAMLPEMVSLVHARMPEDEFDPEWLMWLTDDGRSDGKEE